MGEMKTSRKTAMKASLLIIALALLAGLVWLALRPDEPDEPVGAGVSETSRGTSFEVRVEKPRSALPLFGLLGLLPGGDKIGEPVLRFDHTSRGAQVGKVGHDRLELRADGWELLIEIDGEGRITRGTHLVFPILLAEKQRTLRCRPAERANGYLNAATRADSDVLDGSFLVKLAVCENVETGKVIEWPPSPLTLRGSFNGLPHS